MSLFDSFFIVFKSNAKETQKDVDSLDKSTKNFEKTLRDQNDQLSKIASNLLKIGVEVVATFGGFNILKNGIKNAYDFNLALDKTSKLTGQNAEEVAAWDKTFQSFGGNSGAFTDWFTSYSQFLQSIGQNSSHVLPNLRALADELHRLPEDQARLRFQQVSKATGLPQEFFLSLREGSAALDQVIQKQNLLITANKESEESSRAFAKEWQNAATGIQGAFTDLWKIVAPIFTGILNFLNSTPHIPDWLAKIIPDFFLVKLPGSGGAAPSAPVSSSAPRGIRNNNPGNLMHNGAFNTYPSLDKGIEAEENLLRKYGNMGRDTIGKIVEHWAPSSAGNDVGSYIRDLANRTGFGPNDKLDMSNPSVLAKVANAINAHENGKSWGNLISSAKGALGIADSSSLNAPRSSVGSGASPNMSVGTIVVQTQATDASGIAAAIDDRLKQEYRVVINSFDDGVKN